MYLFYGVVAHHHLHELELRKLFEIIHSNSKYKSLCMIFQIFLVFLKLFKYTLLIPQLLYFKDDQCICKE